VILNSVPEAFGLDIKSATVDHINTIVIGSLIVFFLVVEPHGLARLWQLIREKFILWRSRTSGPAQDQEPDQPMGGPRMNVFTKLAVAGLIAAVAGGTAAAQELHLPNLSYRTGPFAATGTPIMNGQRDYMIMLNERDGGIGGLPVNFEECETGYNTEKGVECYERLKSTALVTQPWSTGITLQVLPQTNVDQIPILAPGYGFSPMSDGRTFQWAFNPPASYWDGAYMILSHLSGGDLATLSGKKIAFLHLDHPYGKEPLPLLEQLAATHGFELLPIPVGLAEMQNQAAQWLQIRREQPDFVVMWGWVR
jgi:branched-chain amino acid transport system substrate-binding protein